tara:strand:- start:340 stop:1119 length:780 start_codon:yes stop_codon:yes gene_type:complete
MVNINSIRHEKEKNYLLAMQIIGALLWLLILASTFGIIILIGLFVLLWLVIIESYFKAVIYGNSVKVNESQYPEIYKIIKEQSEELNLHDTPDVFIYNGNGIINAFAVKFLSKKYVLLMSSLVDLMLKRNRIDELSFIIGHELGHHAAAHTNPWRRALIKPANLIPFLGTAYLRSCELTADRIGCVLTKNVSATKNALVAISLGSESLGNESNIDEFLLQEHQIPALMGFIYKIFATHPMMTHRVREITYFDKIYDYLK